MKPNLIMLIDDNEIDNYINKHFLKQNNILSPIIEMTSAITALDYLSENINNPDKFPDVIFVDINMPIMDGFEFLHQFNTFPETIKRNSKIFILTSSPNPNDIQKAAQTPYVKKYLNKPLSNETLMQIKNDLI